MKKTAIALLALAMSFQAFSQVKLDFESGNRAIDINNCWFFSSTNINASNELQGNYALHTGALVKGTHILISPFVQFSTAGDLTFSTKMTSNDNKGEERLLMVYLLDRTGNAVETLYEQEYAGDKTKVIKAAISLKLSGVYRIKWEFTGKGGSSRGMLDEISIPGTYFADPSTNDGKGDCQSLPVPAEKDTDEDGPSDSNEHYSTDETRAYNINFPAQQVGSLAFEDLWPSKGDYDFNDLVVDYKCQIVNDSKNEIVEIKASFTTRAIGASFHNAFAFQLDGIPSESVIRVTNNFKDAVTGSSFKILPNGTEANQKYATIIVYDDAFRVLPSPGGGSGVNVVEGATYVTPKQIDIVITLKENGKAPGIPIKFLEWPITNFNFFIVARADQGRGIEIHLPDHQPTSLADNSLLGTNQDASTADLSSTYRSTDNLPWALDIPVSFDYPNEKSDIVKSHLKFGAWAESGGKNYKDWYTDKANYRSKEKIYKH